MPPSLVYLKIVSEGRRSFSLWLPVFILWPLVALAGLVILVVLVLAVPVALLFRRAKRVFNWARLGVRLVGLFVALRGLKVQVASSRQKFRLDFV